MSTSIRAMSVLAVVGLLASVCAANWSDSFDNGQFGLTWTFVSFPQVTGTFKQTLASDEAGNGYLTFTETTAVAQGGSAFAAGFGSNEKFKNVRVGATVNVTGDDCHYFYYGLMARASYFMDPDGKLTGVAPGFVADGYILHVDYSNGPANLAINIEKVKMNQNVMDKTVAAAVPGVLNARSFYAELEVVGAGPVTVTGRLYESKGGALVAQCSFVDTNAKDPWEDAAKQEKVFTEGLCGIFAQNEQGDGEPAGFTCSWDDVSAVSDFTVEPSLAIDDFEGYADDAQLAAAWVDNIDGFDYTFVDGSTVAQGYKSMRLGVQNQFEPYTTDATRTFATAQDWTAGGTDLLSLMFRGYYVDPEKEEADTYGCNKEQPLYVKVVDDAGNEATFTLPGYVIQSASWRSWSIPLADITAAGADVTKVKSLTIGAGNGTKSAQEGDDVDVIYIDNISLGFLAN
ncbi:MAG TPA: hypothetical protein PKH24_09920 [Sedimentisphaerales bacterium]|jgi:hypothetical protein|nr:hypothetical protein [Sedimentisphaerales bacterium]HNU28758.1 hypothetical protein [Sedimentisphaerales bacterium]